VSERRFPPPWSVEDIGAAFVVKDGSGGIAVLFTAGSFLNDQNSANERPGR